VPRNAVKYVDTRNNVNNTIASNNTSQKVSAVSENVETMSGSVYSTDDNKESFAVNMTSK
jgi:hypothetical protein